MNQAEAFKRCEEIRKLVGEVPGGSPELRRKVSMIVNQLVGAVPPELGLRAKSLREQLALWFARGKLKTDADAKLCRNIIIENLHVLENDWDRRRAKTP